MTLPMMHTQVQENRHLNLDLEESHQGRLLQPPAAVWRPPSQHRHPLGIDHTKYLSAVGWSTLLFLKRMKFLSGSSKGTLCTIPPTPFNRSLPEMLPVHKGEQKIEHHSHQTTTSHVFSSLECRFQHQECSLIPHSHSLTHTPALACPCILYTAALRDSTLPPRLGKG